VAKAVYTIRTLKEQRKASEKALKLRAAVAKMRLKVTKLENKAARLREKIKKHEDRANVLDQELVAARTGPTARTAPSDRSVPPPPTD
jgi:chromosome segregation ATPase